MRIRRYRTARGRVSNRGDLPRFIGLFPCWKADGGVLVFRSIAELRVAEYLSWSPHVVSIAYESKKFVFEAHGSIPALECWPDFEVVLDSGEIEWVEAKHSRKSLSPDERDKLAWWAAHFEREHRRFRVIYREDVEATGFSATISLLRRYGELRFTESVLNKAQRALSAYPAGAVEDWLHNARSAQVRADVLYHLLYQQRLPMLTRALTHPEILRCRS